MNCSLCKYRTQVIGFEGDVGAPQESHHHHVEGIGTGDGHHDHHHAHHHDHSPPAARSKARQRCGETLTPATMPDYLRDPAAIYARSFDLVRAEVALDRFPTAARHGAAAGPRLRHAGYRA